MKLAFTFGIGLLFGMVLMFIITPSNPCVMFNESIDMFENRTGFYSSDGFYCVETAGRSIEAINRTEYHEAAHALIHRNPEHFCSKYCDSLKWKQ